MIDQLIEVLLKPEHIRFGACGAAAWSDWVWADTLKTTREPWLIRLRFRMAAIIMFVGLGLFPTFSEDVWLLVYPIPTALLLVTAFASQCQTVQRLGTDKLWFVVPFGLCIEAVTLGLGPVYEWRPPWVAMYHRWVAAGYLLTVVTGGLAGGSGSLNYLRWVISLLALSECVYFGWGWRSDYWVAFPLIQLVVKVAGLHLYRFRS